MAEFRHEIALSVQQLPAHRLAPGKVGIGLHPHTADRDDATILDSLLQPGEEIRMILFEPGRMLSGWEGKDVGWVGVDEVELVGDCSSDLASGFAQWPQPGGVNVGVADGSHRLGRVMRGAGQGRG